ncbi:MAG: hypothetical protein ACYDH9_08220 [Limisphaerales bacterium]
MGTAVEITIKSAADLAAVERAGQSLSKLVGLGSALDGLGQKLTSAFAAGTFIELTREAINSEAELGKMSQKVGIAVETLSTLSYAAKASELDVYQFQFGLKILNDQMVNAANGLLVAKQAFAALGIQFQNNDGTMRQTDAVLLDIADKFKAMPDGALKTAEAVKLFGRAGIELIPFLDRGRDGIEALQQKYKDLGLQISVENVKAAEEFKEGLIDLEAVGKGAFLGLANEALPALIDLVAWLNNALNSGRDLRGEFSGLADIVKVFAIGLVGAGAGLQEIGTQIGYLGAAVQQAAMGHFAAAWQIFEDLSTQIDAIEKKADDAVVHIWQPPKQPSAPQAAAAQMPYVDPVQEQKEEATMIEESLKIGEAWTKAQEATLQASYEADKTAYTEYFDKRKNFIIGQFDAERSVLTKELALAVDEVQRQKLTGALQILGLQQDAELTKLGAERDKAAKKATDDAAKAAKKAAEDAKKVAEEQVTLSLARVAAAEHGIDSNPFLTQDEKAKQLLPILTQENALIQKQVDIYAQRAKDPNLSDAARIEAEKQIVQLKGKEADVSQKIVDLQARNFSGELQRQMTAIASTWQNVGMDFARITTNTITASVQGLSNALTSIIMGSQSAAQAFSQFAVQMATQFISSILEMLMWAYIAIPILTYLGIVSGGSTVAAGLTMTTLAASMAPSIAASGMGHAEGGPISGPGTSTSDSIPAWLSAGEYVMCAEAVQAYGPQYMASLNARRISAPVAPLSFAAGGPVGAQAGGGGGGVNVSPAAVHVYFVDDARKLKALLASHEGQKILVNGIMRSKTDLGIPS